MDEDLKREFEKHVEDLYQHILEFQLQKHHPSSISMPKLGKLAKDIFQLEALESNGIGYQGSRETCVP